MFRFRHLRHQPTPPKKEGKSNEEVYFIDRVVLFVRSKFVFGEYDSSSGYSDEEHTIVRDARGFKTSDEAVIGLKPAFIEGQQEKVSERKGVCV